MIYLIAAREVGLCKIGYAANPTRRIAVLSTASPFDLDLIATREGTVYFEKKLHRAASAFHVRREWFRFCPEIVALFHAADDPFVVQVGNRTHRTILRESGHDRIITLTGLPVTTVRSWDQRDSIPADMWLTLADAEIATLEELAGSASRKRPSQDVAA